jgi:DNA-binding NarL/FixJ family response regulator
MLVRRVQLRGLMVRLSLERLGRWRNGNDHAPMHPEQAVHFKVEHVTKIMIVEDDPVFLNRFCRIVMSAPEFELCAALGNGAAALETLIRTAPDVLLVDLDLPDMSGIEIIRETAQRHPQTDIMVVTVFGDERHVLASIEAGATGYLLKDSLPDEFIALINQLRAGGSPISPVIARVLLRQLRPSERPAPPTSTRLSGREVEILSLIAKGFSFAEIGRLLTISAHTVTTHVKKLYQKLAVHSRGEAVYEATRMGLLMP